MENNNNKIIWKDIIIDKNVTNYEVNNIGQVRNKITNKILKPIRSEKIDNTYLHVALFINKKPNYQLLHRLVASAFIPNNDPKNKLFINHINGIKNDNRIENLEWCTASENTKHAYSIGLCKSRVGTDNNFTKYNDDQIHMVCKLLTKFLPMRLISELTNVTSRQVKKIKNGQHWKYISSLYNINYHEKYKSHNIKYKELKKILIELNIFDKINLLSLLNSDNITHKKKLIEDLENLDYTIFIDSKLIKEL